MQGIIVLRRQSKRITGSWDKALKNAKWTTRIASALIVIIALATAMFAAGKPASKTPAKKAKKAAQALAVPAIAAQQLDTAAANAKASAAGDAGVHGILADGDALWVGRKGGVRRYDTATGDSKYFPLKQCEAGAVIALARAGDALWAITEPLGKLCVLDITTGKWHIPGNWRLRENTTGASQIAFVQFPLMVRSGDDVPPPLAGRILVNGQGGPESEGISVIDHEHEKWLALLKSKPAQAFWAGPETIWAAVSEGILQIDLPSGKYIYHLYSETGCGSAVTGIVETSYGVFAASKPADNSELGLAMKVFREGVAVLARPQGARYAFRWRFYRRDQGRRLNDDLSTFLVPRNFKTPGGLCRYKDGKWSALSAKQGLPDNTVTAFASDDAHLYAATSRGLAVIGVQDFKVINTMPDVRNVAMLAVSGTGLWAATGNNDLFRLDFNTLAP